MAELARSFGISTRSIKRRSAEEGWPARRAAFRKEASRRGCERAAEEAGEGAALIFKIARLLLEKFYRALREDGVDLSPHHAATWAQILLALEQAGRAEPEQRIIVRWVAGNKGGGENDEEGNNDPDSL